MEQLPIRGPYFDELEVGAVLDDAPAVTLTSGMQATHHSIVGSRLKLVLDARLATAVTGGSLAPPALVWDVSIGQSTGFTQHVMANLFYRGLGFRRFPRLGDTLTTKTTVRRPQAELHCDRTGHPVASRCCRSRRPTRTGVPSWTTSAARCFRCPRVPVRRQRPTTSPRSGPPPAPGNWERLSRVGASTSFVEQFAGLHFDDLTTDLSWEVSGADLVSSGPELARLTGNLAAVHHDAAAGGGSRLVYGGHTIGLALHQLTRALPNLVTVVGWHSCDHLGPVREGDLLTSAVSVEALEPLRDGGGLVQLRVEVSARGTGDRPPSGVLDWRLSAVMA